MVVADPDNAATELIEEGVNGFVAESAAPDELADAIVRVYEAGRDLREPPRPGSRVMRSAVPAATLDTTLPRPRASS